MNLDHGACALSSEPCGAAGGAGSAAWGGSTTHLQARLPPSDSHLVLFCYYWNALQSCPRGSGLQSPHGAITSSFQFYSTQTAYKKIKHFIDFFLKFFFLMCMGVLPPCMHV